jgi:hypothetical protein
VSTSIESRHEVTWRSNEENWLYDMKYSKSQPLESQCQSKIKCGYSHKVKEKLSGKNQYCVSSSWRTVFMFYLKYSNVTLSRGIPHGLPTKSECSHSLKIQVRRVKHNGIIHYTSHWIRKNKTVWFHKPECSVLPIMAIFQISDVLVLKLDVPVSTG